MSGLLVGIVLATAVVFWVLHPVVAGLEAPMDRDDEELTEAQHRKRMALYALRDVEYDYHAGKLDEADYRSMKREISSEALAALDAEEREWAAREGRRRAAERSEGDGTPGDAGGAEAAGARVEATGDATSVEEDATSVEEEIAALRASLRQGAVCRECGHPSPRGSRFCRQCGARFPRDGGAG